MKRSAPSGGYDYEAKTEFRRWVWDRITLHQKYVWDNPLWVTKYGTKYWSASEINDRHLRELVDQLLLSGSRQYWCRLPTNEAMLFVELRCRGLWTDKDELQSRLEGVVKR
jgi:hypothetical protein